MNIIQKVNTIKNFTKLEIGWKAILKTFENAYI